MTSNELFRALSRGMLFLGAILFVVGLGFSLPILLDQVPPPVESDAGAVVLAATAEATATPQPTEVPPTATPTATPSVVPTVTATGLPTATPTLTPTPTPSPTPLPSDPPVRVVAPAIKLDAKVVPMSYHLVKRNGKTFTEWIVPSNAAGWITTSAPPGQPGNTVISGHHNIEGKVFRYVVNLEPGDTITLYAGNRTYEYAVTEKYILKEAGMPAEVRRKNAQWISPTQDERLTLTTCWPYEWPGNTHRVIVVAKPVS